MINVNDIFICNPASTGDYSVILHKESGLFSGEIFSKGNLISEYDFVFSANDYHKSQIPYIIITSFLHSYAEDFKKEKYGTALKISEGDLFWISETVFHRDKTKLFKIIRNSHYIMSEKNSLNLMKIPTFLVEIKKL